MKSENLSSPLSILLLEDQRTDVMLVSQTIRKEFPDASIEVAQDWASYEELIQQESFDIILSDFNLPAHNGLDALVLARSILTHTPFVFVTGALDDEELVAKSILRGATGYVLKKNLGRLPSAMTKAIAKKRAKRAKAKRKAELAEKEHLLLDELRAILTRANLCGQSVIGRTMDELLAIKKQADCCEQCSRKETPDSFPSVNNSLAKPTNRPED
ncbi:response regulator [Flavilitoribacter nigricans]|uniref:Response regulatory domain-containing protein n=1 Tax=Flavilitoribacter nigricans (strain ATCC 23147 / DSM 23189 / NBRC 102662 / NCIMB 1420 / SS-2) TaxID=1122177 RepID=A0A2D0NEP7_FLAN2|nr:response regulator [Flavilitoribacter nigricans]PHN06981.1 hypothetical protein CRP01_08450 [Flavilitoribacter nigricans DSM 23189 = NBRC 102662]